MKPHSFVTIAVRQRQLLRTLVVTMAALLALFALTWAVESGVLRTTAEAPQKDGEIDRMFAGGFAGFLFVATAAFSLPSLGYLLFRLMVAMRTPPAEIATALLLFAMSAPVLFVDAAIILFVSVRATTLLRSRGLRVGLLGVPQRELNRLRDQMPTALLESDPFRVEES